MLENPGFYKFRKGGEPHATDPDVVDGLQESVKAAHALIRAVRGDRLDEYDRFARLVEERPPLEPRDLLELVPAGDVRAAAAAQTLLSEAEMGELFKVLLLAKGLGENPPLPGFAQGDRLHTL